MTARKLFEMPATISYLDKYVVPEPSHGQTHENASNVSIDKISKSGDLPSEQSPIDRMYRVRLPIALRGEALQGEVYEPGALNTVFYIYSALPQTHWNDLQTCIALK